MTKTNPTSAEKFKAAQDAINILRKTLNDTDVDTPTSELLNQTLKAAAALNEAKTEKVVHFTSDSANPFGVRLPKGTINVALSDDVPPPTKAEQFIADAHSRGQSVYVQENFATPSETLLAEAIDLLTCGVVCDHCGVKRSRDMIHAETCPVQALLKRVPQ